MTFTQAPIGWNKDKHRLKINIPEPGTRGSEVVETINEAVLDHTWRKLPQNVRDAIKLGAEIGWESGSTMPDGSPNPIQVQDLEPLLNLSPQVLSYKAVRAGISRGLGFDPRLVDQASLAIGGASLLRKGIQTAIPKVDLAAQRAGLKPHIYKGSSSGSIPMESLSKRYESIINEAFNREKNLLGEHTYGSLLKQNPFLLGGKSATSPGYAYQMGRGKPSTPERVRNRILQNKMNPSIEELEQAVVGPGVEGLRPKPTYVRPAETSAKQWEVIGKRLQKKHGGTDGQVQAFIQLQLANKKQLEADLVKINEKAQFDYLEFAATAMEALGDAGYPTGTLTDDDMYKLFITIASNPKAARVFDKGHIRSAKNIWRETKLGTPTTADYRSNLAIEQKASIRNFMRIDPKTGEAELIIPGNIKRGSRTDAPKIVDMLRGTSPNVDIEYYRFLHPKFDAALTDIVPFERHGHFMEYLRNRVKKWQGRGKDRLHGKQQLDQYREKLNEFIDDYLNEQELGEWELDDKAKSDFIDDLMRNRKPLHNLDLSNEKDINKLIDEIIFKRIAPEEYFPDKPL